MDRRTFTKMAAAATLASAGAVTGLLILDDNGEPIAFELRHSPDIGVWIKSSAAGMSISIRRNADRAVLETFENVSAQGVLGLDSEYAQFSRTALPTAA